MTDTQANQLSALYNKYINNVGKTTLWTNPSPNAAFTGVTITADITKYTYIVTYTRGYVGHNQCTYNAFVYPYIGDGNNALFCNYDTGISVRGITISATNFVIASSGSMSNTTNGWNGTTSAAVPQYVYGI